jgi:hypothetical protein
MNKQTKFALLGVLLSIFGALVWAGGNDMTDIIAWGVYNVNEFRINRYGAIIQTTNASATNSLVATTITGATNITGATGVTGNLTVTSGALGIYARTSTQVKATTPTVVGQTYFDTTIQKLVIASGTSTSFDWVLSTGGRATNY